MHRDVFVTGTDAGVGKTIVSAALARLRQAVYVKPVQAGAADGDDDAADVAALADVPTIVGPAVGPRLAPGVAARLAGADLAGEELVAIVDEARAAHPDRPLVVEGSGGLLDELGSDGTTCEDLAVALSLAVVVVTQPGVGSLNHTALTVASLRRRGLTLAGVVACGVPQGSDPSTRIILGELDRASGSGLSGVVPQLATLHADALVDAAAWFLPALGGTADRRPWLGT